MGVRLATGCLGEELKKGKRRQLTRSGRREHRKWKGRINRQGQAQGLAVGQCACLAEPFT